MVHQIIVKRDGISRTSTSGRQNFNAHLLYRINLMISIHVIISS